MCALFLFPILCTFDLVQRNKTNSRIKIRKRTILSAILSRQNQNGYIVLF